MILALLQRRESVGGVRASLVACALTGLFLLGCDPPASGPEDGVAGPPTASADARAAFAARVLATRDRARAQASSRAAARPPVVWPAPEATPTGGRRIDLRKIPDHVRTLERQPDGTWKQFCRDAPRPTASGSGQ
jgi:hypothetical protein